MLSKFSVKKPYTVVVAVVLVLILGVISFVNLQTDLLPEIDLPFLLIMTQYPGASPEEVEMVITKPIEQVVATTNNIKNISSISNENSSIVILEFNNDVNMDSTLIEVNGAIDLIKGFWDDSVSSPMIIRLNPDMLPVMISSIDIKDMEIGEISRLVDNTILPDLESINGVASVDGVGLIEEKIQVVISEAKIEKLNKKILKTIDSELSEVEDKLTEAKDEIRSNKSKLDQEEKSQLKKIGEGENAIKLGKEEIDKGLKQISQGESQLIQAKDEAISGLDELIEKESMLKLAKDSLLNLDRELTQEERIKLASLEESLKVLEGKKEEITIALQEINSQIGTIVEQKSALEGKRAELSLQEKDLIKGKEILGREIASGKSQLIEGENTLNQKIEELDVKKEEAFENASLDGVITKEMISGILTAQNFSMPAGYVEDDGTEYLVKVGDKLADTGQMKNLLLFDSGMDDIGNVYLKDVADVDYIDNSNDIYAKVNGNNAIMLVFQKQSNFSISEVSDNINEKFENIMEEVEGLSITNLMDQGEYINIVVGSVLNNILYGGILAIIILFLFLRDIKPTFIISLSVPISIVFAIALMYFTGVTINIISLAGLALGVGMLVDNSIVVIENIFRLRNEGMPAMEASIEGAREVSGAILASTITTACVFLPIVFTSGISRQLFVDMGLTIAYSLFASLIVALSLVPTLTSSLLKNTKKKEEKSFNKFINKYENILKWSLGHKALVSGFVLIILALSVYLTISMGTSFIPEMEAPQMSASLTMPKKVSFEDSIEMADMVIDRISNIEGIKTIGAFQASGMGGMGGMGGMSPGGGGKTQTMSLYLLLDENKKITNEDIGKEMLRLTEDLDVEVSVTTSNMDMSALGGEGIEILIKGREIDKLREIAIDIGKIVEEIEGTIDVTNGIEENLTEMRIIVDKEKAMENGLTVAQVFSHVNKVVSKSKSSTTLSINNKDYPVIVIDEKEKIIGRNDLEKLEITVGKGEEEKIITIGEIANVVEAEGLSSIKRQSQERYLSVKAGISPGYNIGLVSQELENKIDKEYKAPDGYKIEFSGENEMIKKSLRDLVYMLLLAVVLIYLIMVAQFQSLLSPFIIMFTLPLAFTGGLLALYITGNEISLISMLGFLVLAGVVVNNGIVFVDYTNQLRARGNTVDEALIMAGKTRIRPILMTAITTILGLSTLSLGVGVGSEMIQPLAIVAVGGLAYATVLTLIVVPVMYRVLHKDK